MRLLLRVFLLILTPVSIYAGYKLVREYYEVSQSQAAAPTPSAAPRYVELPNLDVLLVQQSPGSVSTETPTRRILQCDGTCRLAALPDSSSPQAVTDGTSWYDIITLPAESKKDTPRQAIVRTFSSGQPPQTIVEQTPLIAPRELMISPDGKKVAYFLDNIADPSKHLTEIWVYDSEAGGASLAAEKIYAPDIVTRPRWNSSGTLLWFIANSGTAQKEKIEFVVVSVSPPGMTAAFASVPWDEMVAEIAQTPLDISLKGNLLAYTEPNRDGSSTLVAQSLAGGQMQKLAKGAIPYIQILSSNEILYASQEPGAVTFWMLNEKEAKEIASYPGTLRAARGESGNQFVAFAAQNQSGQTELVTLNIASGLTKKQASVPAAGGNLYVVRATTATPKQPAVAGFTTKLSDEELVAFIQAHHQLITGPETQLKRLLITSEPNTLYIDYLSSDNTTRRLLLSVRSDPGPQWSIRARYEPIGGQWQKTEGGGLTDPDPARIYEWEQPLSQWILKSTLDK